MMRFGRAGFALLCLVAAACGQAEAPAAKEDAAKADAADEGVALTAEQTENLGIVTMPARVARYVPELRGYGVVVGWDAIAQSEADLATASAAANQSQAAAARARELSTGEEAAISRDALDVALRQETADNAALALARRRGSVLFGQDAPWLDARQHGAVIAKLAGGKAALVRATFPLGALGDRPSELTFRRLGGNADAAVLSSKTIWTGPADPAVPGQTLFALVDGNLANGERVLVAAPAGAPQDGILIPADAVVLSDSMAWFYLRDAKGHYVRHAVALSSAMPGGYFLKSDVAAGAAIVTAGAGLLLAHETNPSTDVPD